MTVRIAEGARTVERSVEVCSCPTDETSYSGSRSLAKLAVVDEGLARSTDTSSLEHLQSIIATAHVADQRIRSDTVDADDRRGTSQAGRRTNFTLIVEIDGIAVLTSGAGYLTSG